MAAPQHHLGKETRAAFLFHHLEHVTASLKLGSWSKMAAEAPDVAFIFFFFLKKETKADCIGKFMLPLKGFPGSINHVSS
jgi:hypothetical protein